MPSKRQSDNKTSTSNFPNQSPLPFTFPGPDKKHHDQDEQKLLLEALKLASDTSDYPNSQKRKEFLDSLHYLQSEQPLHLKPAVKISESPLSDDRLLKRKYRNQANAQEAAALRSTFIQGPFSKTEREQVQMAVDTYLQEKGIPLSDLHYLVHRKTKITVGGSPGSVTTNPYSAPEYKGFIAEILQKSQINRSMDQLYWFMSRAYSDHRSERRRWTEEEDARLRFLVELKGTKWKEIERELVRTDCRARWKKIKGEEVGEKSGRWEEDEEQRLNDGITQLMAEHDMTDCNEFNRWSELAKKVKTRSDVQCRNKFMNDASRRYGGSIFAPRVHWSTEDDHILLNKMITLCSKASHESEVIWDNLTAPDWKTWRGSTLQKRWLILKSKVPGHETMFFTDIIHYCLENLHLISKAKKRRRDIFIQDGEDDEETLIEETQEQSRSGPKWTPEDYQELLSRLLTLYSDIEDESEIDWNTLVWRPWDSATIQTKWEQLRSHILGRDSMTFMGMQIHFSLSPTEMLNYVQDNIAHLSAKVPVYVEPTSTQPAPVEELISKEHEGASSKLESKQSVNSGTGKKKRKHSKKNAQGINCKRFFMMIIVAWMAREVHLSPLFVQLWE